MKTLQKTKLENSLKKMYKEENVNHQKVNDNMKKAINLLRNNVYPNLSDDELIDFNNKFSNFLRF